MASQNLREIFLTNSMTGKREQLQTHVPGKVSFYSCGPTVYNLIHIGNLRAALTSDLFFRIFLKFGYEVNYTRNYTDVDDKIIERSKEEKMTADLLAKKYIQEVEKDYALAGMLEPHHKTCVTDHIPEIISMIEKIIKNGHGYVAPDGEVLFSVESFQGYGKLSGKNLEDLQAGHRVEVRDHKKNPFDFSLWKPAKPGEPFWESPWCKGRPGWHIECSAMSAKWLGDQIDVHHGGEDLIFPHHENEIAQSEAASGKAPFVKIWVHNGFLNMNQQKMSKSLGNVVSARDFLSQFGQEVTRYLLLSSHYRAPIDFGDESLENALQGLSRIYEAKAKAIELTRIKAAVPHPQGEVVWGEWLAASQKARDEIQDCFASDLNTAGALGSLFTLIRDFNRTLNQVGAGSTSAAVIAGNELIRIIEDELGSIMGIGKNLPEKTFSQIEQIRAHRAQAGGKQKISEDEIKQAIEARKQARAQKNFAEADRIRKELESKGVILKDGPTGTTWTFQ